MEVWVNLLTAHRIGVNENMSYWRGFRQIQRTSRLDVVGVWSFTLQIWNFFVSEWEAEQIKASNFSIIVFTGRRFERCCCQNSLFIYSSENFKLKIVDLAFQIWRIPQSNRNKMLLIWILSKDNFTKLQGNHS